MPDAKEVARIACRALEEKKGEEIRLIDISHVSIIADYFLLVTGRSKAQLGALVDAVEEAMDKIQVPLLQREGTLAGGWILLDFGTLIVHIFDQEKRIFYDLERIWRDGQTLDPSNL